VNQQRQGRQVRLEAVFFFAFGFTVSEVAHRFSLVHAMIILSQNLKLVHVSSVSDTLATSEVNNGDLGVRDHLVNDLTRDFLKESVYDIGDRIGENFGGLFILFHREGNANIANQA
jgi:hypothetical protein